MTMHPGEIPIVHYDLPLREFPFTFEVRGTHSDLVLRTFEVTGPGVLKVENLAEQYGEYVYVRRIKDGRIEYDDREKIDHTGCPWCDPA